MLRVPSRDSDGPWGIWCEIPGLNLDRALSLFSSAMEEEKIGNAKWTIVPDDETPLDLATVQSLNFPCQRFGLGFTYDLESLDTMPLLATVKMSSGFFATDICAFRFHGEEAHLEVRTNPKGHRLFAPMGGKCLRELEDILGVGIREC